jgi:septal ring factor EnvC (AmiA/AmiB activator)
MKIMKKSLFVLGLVCTLALVACVPVKKYQDLLAREKSCADELEKYKNQSTDYEGKAKSLQEKLDLLTKDVEALKKDKTTNVLKFI